MPRRLLTVDDVFAITGRGTVVVPHLVPDPAWPAAVRLELRRPDGTVALTTGHVRLEHLLRCPPGRSEYVWTLCLDEPKSLVPLGTEVWTAEES
jgi:hypothetical protein